MPDRAASAVRGTGGDHADRYLVAGLVAADGVLYGAIDDCGRTALSFVYDFILMPTEGTPDDLACRRESLGDRNNRRVDFYLINMEL